MTRSYRFAGRSSSHSRAASTGTSTAHSGTPPRDTSGEWPLRPLTPSTIPDFNFVSEAASSAILTPRWSSAFTFSASASAPPRPRSAFAFTASNGNPFLFQDLGSQEVDRPIPSTENGSAPSAQVVFPRPQSAQSATPSVSVSPPPPNSAIPSRQSLEGAVNEIGAGLRGIRLSNFASPSSPGLRMGDLAAALPSPAIPSPIPVPLLRPQDAARNSESPQPSASRRSTPRGRRSSSVNQTPYDVRNDEDPPRDRFHDPAFQQAFDNAKSLMSDLAGVLGSSNLRLHLQPDSAIHDLRERADKLAKFQCAPTRIVGLVGDSGVGKSSLLNSLLDFKGLARTSDSGAACTCVVTEYLYHDTDGFTVNIETFSQDELKKQFADMVHDYRHNRLHSADMELAEERRNWEKQADLACDYFSAMFRGRFNTSLLRSDKPEDQMVETLLAWAQEFGPANIKRSETTNSIGECTALLSHLTSEEGSAQGPAVWPYIKKISVFLKAHVLSKGLILVDLPGLHDLNAARRNITERYLLKCDEIFAVCCIGRATTDAGVMGVFELARQARLSNVGIICTRSDNTNATEAKRDFKDRATEIRRLIGEVDTVKRELTDMDERRKELEDIEEEDLWPEEEAEKNKIYQAIVKKRAVIENRKFELKRYIMTARNKFVTDNLAKMYKDKIPGGNLRVFCAGNIMYWDYRDVKPKEKALPFLQLSGIPAIRRHCMTMVSEGQLRVAIKYMRDDIPDVVSNVDLWVRSGAGSADAAHKQAVRKAVDELETRLRGDLLRNTSQINTLSGTFIKEFNERLYQWHRHRIDGWTKGAVKAGSGWSSWHHSIYSAFCANNGIHQTPKAGYHNWNEEAMSTMVQDLSEPWDEFRSTLVNHLIDTFTSVDKLFDWASNRVDELMDRYGDSVLLPLYQALTSRQHILTGAIESKCEEFEGHLSTLRTDALEGLETSFFARSMEDTYSRAKYESGTGSFARKKDIINGRLRENELFREWMRKFRNKLRELATTLQTDVQDVVLEQLDIIRGTLDIVRSDHAATESEEDPEFRTRVEEEVRRVNAAMEQVWAAAGLNPTVHPN
ncbi:nuclear GTPase SLIP-GC [Diplogelasinospora grovesii]|uniref:Nuclear GTPase SLIP-GC n=1 Tax=Diplogelasinospora grovesii TaxID=303347 RepID=A0AAN6S2Q4_9PEZI|nr:nuclear GTPase SLIP-GC [Diplogelasinospora grovesii]